jgi:hypothetical protein
VTPLVRRLIQIQSDRRESDRQFAAHLGLDWSYWSYVRRDERTGGKKLIEAACRAFPEARSLVGLELSNDHQSVDNEPIPAEAAIS